MNRQNKEKNNLFYTTENIKNCTLFCTFAKEKIKKIIYLALLPLTLVGQEKTSFVSPLDIPMLLAGNFAEIRPNHFHAGVDMKTMSVEGKNILSVEDGEIVRISVRKNGYGKALYVQHPNGYTSLYAHLREFAPQIQDFVKKKQYHRERFDVDIYPPKGTFLVKKSEQIAFSGNTGGSQGPHLHFEIRDTRTANTLNPLLFGYKAQDDIPPKIYRAFLYPLSQNSVVEGSQIPIEINISKKSDTLITCQPIKAIGKIAIGVQSIDKINYTPNVFGLYKAKVYVNGKKIFGFTFNELSFAQDSLINEFIDYRKYVQEKITVQKLYKEPQNNLSIYDEDSKDGYIDVEPGFKYSVEVVVEDFSKNKTKIQIPIVGEKTPVKVEKPQEIGNLLIASRENIYSVGDFTISFPKQTFLKDTNIRIIQNYDTLKIEPKYVPMYKSYTIETKSKSGQEKGEYIASVNEKYKSLYPLKTTLKNGTLSARTKYPGSFVVANDQNPPQIRPIGFSKEKNNIGKLKTLKVEIKDKETKIESYRATINGKWALFEYDQKTNTIVFDKDDLEKYMQIQDKELNLDIEVWDGVGNKTTYSAKLIN